MSEEAKFGGNGDVRSDTDKTVYGWARAQFVLQEGDRIISNGGTYELVGEPVTVWVKVKVAGPQQEDPFSNIAVTIRHQP